MNYDKTDRPRVEDFLFNSMQGIIFTPNPPATSGKILGQLLAAFSDRYDGTPMMLPIPKEAPPDIPRLILQSADLQWAMDVSLNRVNFRWVQMSRDHSQTLEQFTDFYLKFVDRLLDIHPLIVDRLAFFCGRYFLTENSASIISSIFLKESFRKVATVPESLEFHVHQKVKVAGLDSNEWLRIKSGILSLPNAPQQKILYVEQDTNTLPEGAEQGHISIEQLKLFAGTVTNDSDARFRAIWGS